MFNSLALLVVCLSLSCSTKLCQLYTPTWKGPSPPYDDPVMIQHAKFLIDSYRAVMKKELIPLQESNDDKENAKKLFNLQDRVVLSHGIQPGPPEGEGPILNYGNLLALELWKASYDELTIMPSKYTAEEMERSAREAFLQEVNVRGVVTDYTGVRIARDKSKFIIKRAVVWNVVIGGKKIGQAATFDKWEPYR